MLIGSFGKATCTDGVQADKVAILKEKAKAMVSVLPQDFLEGSIEEIITDSSLG